MAKRKQELEAVPVDKLDQFVKTHYKKILTVAGAAIIAVLAIYGVINILDGRKQASYDALGQYELAGLYTTDSIMSYAALADSYAAQKDFIYYEAGASLVAIGNREAAVEMLRKVGGEYKVFADSLLYDITSEGTVDAALFDSRLGAVWYYRAALSAPSVEEAASIAVNYRIKWPQSELAGRLTKWGI